MTTLQSTTERLEEALRRLAVEASDLFEELLASGAELPFDLEPSEGPGLLPMYSYAPLTGQFIGQHLAELRRLEAFVEVRDIAGEEAALGFLIGLWEGKSEFEIAGDRLEGAIDGVLSTISTETGDSTATGEVIVPLAGFHMPGDEIELDGVRIVRAENFSDAPVEAIEATKSGGDKPGFFATVSCKLASVAPAAVIEDELRRTLRTLRLFRSGAVGLHPQGWAKRVGGWERFGTGAGRPRHGGYRLTGNEAGELERFSGKLTERGSRIPSLEWAASRFELGAERSSLIEALSDYLLALRGLLEGGGPAQTNLSARVAALACEPHEREQGRVTIERALAIERKLMSGGRYRPTAGSSPLDVIAEVEELLRRLLQGLATGELSGDLRAAADEKLLSNGLDVTARERPQLGEAAEWRLPEPNDESAAELDLSAVADGTFDDAEIEVHRISEGTDDGQTTEVGTETNQIEAESVRGHEDDRDPTTRIVVDHVELPEIMGPDGDPPASPQPESGDWFSAADGELEWPAFARPRRAREGEGEREPSTDRVRHLFPVPDATDWSVGELRYERRSGRS